MTESSDKEFMEQDMLIERKADNDGLCSKLLKTRSSRLAAMLSLIIVYFLAEIIVGHISNSLTLVADSFHMLSDGLALIVALVAVRMSKRKATDAIQAWPSKQRYFNTFGWVRFEVVGALINATFLLALCISILMEAVEKFYEPQFVSKPLLVLGVGGGGLLINICGLFMFGSDAHGHDHGNHSHSNSEQANGNCQKPHSDVESGKTSKTSSESSKSSVEAQMNMKAVFLHVLGDALGSVIVMISATIVYFVPHKSKNDEEKPHCNSTPPTIIKDTNHDNHWIVYLDPVMTVLLVLIMISTTVPLFKKSSLILLQTVPKHLNLSAIQEQLETIEGLQDFHDFHIWQLAGDKYVATVHIHCSDSQTYIRVAKEMKLRLHNKGIHSLTIQPEFKRSPSKSCSMGCDSSFCKTKVCCEISSNPPQKKQKSKMNMENNVQNQEHQSNNVANRTPQLNEAAEDIIIPPIEAPETIV